MSLLSPSIIHLFTQPSLISVSSSSSFNEAKPTLFHSIMYPVQRYFHPSASIPIYCLFRFCCLFLSSGSIPMKKVACDITKVFATNTLPVMVRLNLDQ